MKKGGLDRPSLFFASGKGHSGPDDPHAGGLRVALQGLISYTSRLFSAGNRPASFPSVEL
jgi:hypothetical protein